jgi:peptide subunit release factor 1 (eRF1)
VLLGSQETLTKLQSVLSTEVAERVVGQAAADLRAEEDALVAAAYELFFQEERAEEARLWERIQTEYLRDGLAVVGPAAVLDALHQGRVAELLVTRDADLQGPRCAACERVVAVTVNACPVCGENQVFPVDLINELVHQAELTSITVEFSDPMGGLTSVGDVAAMLRY